jgi:hypothetical protein
MCSFIFGLGSKFFTRIAKIWQFYCPKEHVLKTCTVNVFAVTCWPLWVLHVTALVILHKTIWIFLQPFPLQSMKLNLFLPEVRWPLIDYKVEHPDIVGVQLQNHPAIRNITEWHKYFMHNLHFYLNIVLLLLLIHISLHNFHLDVIKYTKFTYKNNFKGMFSWGMFVGTLILKDIRQSRHDTTVF